MMISDIAEDAIGYWQRTNCVIKHPR